MDDNKLLDMYFARDESAIRLTQERYGAYCFTVANNILSNREDAEECVNDTYLKAWNTIPPKRPNVFRLYLARIARNLSLDRYEKRMAEKRGGGETALAVEELSELTACSVSVEGEIMKRELERSVASFLKSLPERERTMFLMRYFYLTPCEDIAERLGVSRDSLYSSLARIRKKLKKHLEKEGYYNDRQ